MLPLCRENIRRGAGPQQFHYSAVQLKVELKLENLNIALDQAKDQTSRVKLFVVLE